WLRQERVDRASRLARRQSKSALQAPDVAQIFRKTGEVLNESGAIRGAALVGRHTVLLRGIEPRRRTKPPPPPPIHPFPPKPPPCPTFHKSVLQNCPHLQGW